MKAVYWLGLLALVVAVAVAGCGGTSEKKSAAGTASGGTGSQADEATIKANLAKLAPEDRKLAEAQTFCPVSDEPLGEMGTPVKVEVQGQPVFLCCSQCERKALADPGKTLAKAKELRERAAAK